MGRFVGQAVDSVLSQSFQDFELLVVDNCSEDDTVAIVRGFHDKRVKIVRNDRHISMIANWNRCLELARGQYVGLLFADDYYLPNMLEMANKAFSQFEIGVFSGGAECVDVNGIVMGRHARRCVGYISPCDYFRANYCHVDCSPPSETIISRDALNIAGGFDIGLNWVVDRDLYLRIAEAGFAAFHDSHELTARRAWGGNSSHLFRGTVKNFADEFLILNRYKGSSCLRKKDIVTRTNQLTHKAISARGRYLRAGDFREVLAITTITFKGNAKLLGRLEALNFIANSVKEIGVMGVRFVYRRLVRFSNSKET